MLDEGYILINRSILNWEWYDNTITKSLFIHLLLTVNYYDKKWHGKDVKRGQRITSYAKLSEETHLSIRSIRTAFSHLISTHELTIETTPQYTVITILQFDKYQTPTNKPHEKRQTTDKRPTNDRQQINKANKAINIYIGNLALFQDEYDKLVGWFGKAKVDSKIEYAQNYKKIKNYNSLYLTLLNWLKKDNPDVDTSGIKKEPVKRRIVEREFGT